MTVVVFNPAAFKIRYPEFAIVADATLSAYFPEAGLYLSNTDVSPVQDIPRRTMYLNMIVAHIAAMSGVTAADGQPRPVGRVSQAAEGSVSASFEYLTPGTAAWFAQTPYGAAFWQATSSLRGMRYICQPTVY
jgi:hypothetical protein